MDVLSCPSNSADAGKASMCAGCPGQQACRSSSVIINNSKSNNDSEMQAKKLNSRLRGVRHVVLVLSGKGGVGKSLCASLLAQALCEMEVGVDGYEDDKHVEVGVEEAEAVSGVRGRKHLARVAMLDADLCGPSQPTLMHVEGQSVIARQEGWVPPVGPDRLQAMASISVATKGAQGNCTLDALLRANADVDVRHHGPGAIGNRHCVATMSIGSLLPDRDNAVVWRGPRKTHMLSRMLTDTAWGERDWLLVDTPPGTSDEHLAVVHTLKEVVCPDGAIIVTTPQDVSLATVRKELSFCRKMGIPVLGIVENMASLICPCCNEESEMFVSSGAVDGLSGGEALARDAQVPFFGRVPLDPNVTAAIDQGRCVMCECRESPVTYAFRKLANNLVESVAQGNRPR